MEDVLPEVVITTRVLRRLQIRDTRIVAPRTSERELGAFGAGPLIMGY